MVNNMKDAKNFSYHGINDVKHPRTMNEAFGPYSDNSYHSVGRKDPILWWVLGIAFFASILFLVASQS
jgi:hypothetical protein